METICDLGNRIDGSAVQFARCFLRLANLHNFALDRLSRYEANLWRQAGRIICALKILDRCNHGDEHGLFGFHAKIESSLALRRER